MVGVMDVDVVDFACAPGLSLECSVLLVREDLRGEIG